MPEEAIPEQYKPIAQAVQDAKDAILDKSKKKKPQSIDSAGLSKIKGIQHQSCRRVQFAKQKVMAAAWSAKKGDPRMVMADQLGFVSVFSTTKQIRLGGFRKTFVKSLALHGDTSKHLCLVGGMNNATELFVQQSADNPMLQVTKTWAENDGYISSIEWVDDNKFVAASGDGMIGFYDMNSNDPIHKM